MPNDLDNAKLFIIKYFNPKLGMGHLFYNVIRGKYFYKEYIEMIYS